jgi:glycine hydroxymethyltransferase
VTTLGMGHDEIAEIADIIASVLGSVTPAPVAGQEGKLSKAWFELPDPVTAAARDRVAQLLNRFPLYPEIDLSLVQA